MPSTHLRIFISSVQSEFKELRLDLKAFLLGDAVLRRFVSKVFLFEELPAGTRSADDVYLEEVEKCDIYLGIFGYEYGNEDSNGISPTEHEYTHATKYDKQRLVYVWGSNEKKRAPKMKQLVSRASDELVRRRVENFNALTSEVYASFVELLDNIGALRVPPFDTSACDKSSLKSISRKRVEWFLKRARRERNFPLKANTGTISLLIHLNLIENSKPTNAAILLFGNKPQRFHRTAETKCVHCHGTEYKRPFASQQVYSGDLFDQVDQASDFILSKINRAVGTRATGITAPARYELPPGAVVEAVVNAIVHRDYNSNASVEVRLFADRLEVWNPGTLPGTLTVENLRVDHPSIPNNPLLAESLYLTRYIEKAGSGTQAMIFLCQEAEIPEPLFEQRDGFFIVTFWRDWLTTEVLARYNLNERQLKSIRFFKGNNKITNSDYQKLTGAKRKTAARDLEDMVKMGIINRVGEKRGSHYILVVRKQ